MTKLEEKLIELGYKYDRGCDWYCKNRIRITIHKNKIIEKSCCISIKQQIIKNRNDIQYLKDSISYYEEQLKTMQKDLEVLRNVESER